MKRAIIVGSSGQDGRLLFDRLCREGAYVLGIDLDGVRSTDPADAASKIDILAASEVQGVLETVRPDEVYYLAAHHHSSEEKKDENLAHIEKSFAVNVFGLIHFLEGIRRRRPKKESRLFYAASSLVFGRPDTDRQDERTPFAPMCIYGITKAAGVQCCRLYRQAYGVFAATGILYNHESQYRREDFVSQKIIRGAIKIRRGRRSKLTLGNLGARVDWGYAPDYVDAMVRIIRHGQADDFIVATGESHTVKEFVEEVFGRLGLDWRKYVEEAPSLVEKQARCLVGNADKLASGTGWRPSVGFREMVELLLRRQANDRQDR